MGGIREIVDRQVGRWNTERRIHEAERGRRSGPKPAITVSRTLGSGGDEVAAAVAARLGLQLVDRQIVDEIARAGDISRALVEAMDERTRSGVEAWIESLLRGRSFDEADLHAVLLRVVRSFAELGSVVLVGRGACCVPLGRPALHVRLVAPLDHRLARSGRDAAALRASDAERARFVRRLFDRDWEDPLLYDLVVNVGRVGEAAAADLIAAAWYRRAAE